jgi:hypothetical protein
MQPRNQSRWATQDYAKACSPTGNAQNLEVMWLSRFADHDSVLFHHSLLRHYFVELSLMQLELCQDVQPK